MDWQTLSAIALAAAAALWLGWRWWSRGFDDEEKGCSSCSVAKPLASKRPGPSAGADSQEKPVEDAARRP
jgi:hypothetical protein